MVVRCFESPCAKLLFRETIGGTNDDGTNNVHADTWRIRSLQTLGVRLVGATGRGPTCVRVARHAQLTLCVFAKEPVESSRGRWGA